MVQVLFHGRKTGNLKIIERSPRPGEIHFVSRATWSTRSGARRRASRRFYAMIKLADGEFALDPAFKPTERRDPRVGGGAAARGDAEDGRGADGLIRPSASYAAYLKISDSVG